MQVTIYSTTTCPYCNMLKDYLKGHNINFTEKLVDQDDVAKSEMMKSSDGFLGVPFTIVEKAGGVRETIIGFDKGKVNEVFAIQK